MIFGATHDLLRFARPRDRSLHMNGVYCIVGLSASASKPSCSNIKQNLRYEGLRFHTYTLIKENIEFYGD